MDNNPNPLTYHYETRLKIDHFMLGADIALLGWTIVNLDWLPLKTWAEVGIILFWLFIIISLVLGVKRQIYSSSAFGANFMKLHEGDTASLIERTSFQGNTFIDQQTTETMTSESFQKLAMDHRENENKFNQQYEQFNNTAYQLGNWSFYFMIAGLAVLVLLRFIILLKQS